jgi:hypothetical protein
MWAPLLERCPHVYSPTARTGEVIGARVDEMSEPEKVWTVQAIPAPIGIRRDGHRMGANNWMRCLGIDLAGFGDDKAQGVVRQWSIHYPYRRGVERRGPRRSGLLCEFGTREEFQVR